jgi:hypothetical protein
MKLSELMNNAFDETWFVLVSQSGEELYVWNADYLGWHPDVMPILDPYLHREVEEYSIVTRPDPEDKDGNIVPMIQVCLLMDEEEI